MRVAYFLTHPIQYQSPLIRHLKAGGMDLEVIYASDTTSRPYFDPGYGREVAWDVPLLDGYPNVILNKEPAGGSRRSQIKHYRDQLRAVFEAGKFAAAWVHGWHHPYAVAAFQEARARRIPVLLRGDTFLGSINAGDIKRWLHRIYYSRIFRQASVCLAIGSLNRELYLRYGVPAGRVFTMPHAVDNAFFQRHARQAQSRREVLRAQLGIAPGRPVVLFCGRLSPQKDPGTLILAIGRLCQELSVKPALILAGTGPLESGLKNTASTAGETVKFVGFINQTELPAFYDLCDIFVLPSVFEPWGLVVNEVMNAGKPVIVSDKVGAAPDLVKAGRNGDIFKAGDVDDLCRKLRPWLLNPSLCDQGGRESLAIINHWGLDEDLAVFRDALQHLRDHAVD